MESRLVLGRRIAEGGMAEVFAARMIGSEGFAKDIVVKRVLPQLARDPDFIASFLDEARLAAQLSHPSIVQVLQLVVDGDDLMMAMEAIDGADLSTVLKALNEDKRRLPLPLALRIASAVAGALAYAHEKRDRENQPLGIVHRDVTPSNILLSRDGATKLIDFGIARARSVARLTRRGSIVGKVNYLSPEQARGDDLDARVDIWSCGVVLFQMLTGSRPFVGDSDTDIFKRIAAGDRPDVRALADVPEALARIVDGALATNRDARIPTARALAQAIDDVIAKGGLYASATELGDFVAALVPSVDATTARADGLSHTADGDGTGLSDAETLPARKQRSVTRDDATEATFLHDVSPTQLTTSAGEAVTEARTALLELSTRTLRRLPQRDMAPALPRASLRAPWRAASLGAAIVVVALGAWRVVAGEAGPAAAEQRAIPLPIPSAAPIDVVVASPPIEAVADAPVAALPVAAIAVAVEAPRQRERARAKRPRAEARVEAAEPGSLVVDSRPWSSVTIDGVSVGVTPIAPRSLSAGPHTLVLENDEQGLKKVVTVMVKSGKTTTTRLDLRR